MLLVIYVMTASTAVAAGLIYVAVARVIARALWRRRRNG